MKYIVALKEPAWRRLFRYGLWTIIVLSCATILGWGAVKGAQFISAVRLRERVETLDKVSPVRALESARELAQRAPCDTNRILLARVAMEAEEFGSAEAALKGLSTPTALSLAIETNLALRNAPERLPALIKQLDRAAPANDDDRFWVSWACLNSGIAELRPVAGRLLNHISNSHFNNRAALLRLRLSILSGDPLEAAERAGALIGRELPPTDAVELLSIAESLGIPEAADYRSSLKLQSRNDDALRDRLGAYLKTHAARAVETPPPAASEAPASNAQPQAPAAEPVGESLKTSEPTSTIEAAAATSE